jgi:preprotein translocase subunit SecB
MKISPLQLEHYFVSDLHFSANRSFDPAKEPELTNDQFAVEAVSMRDKEKPAKWQITLRIKHQPAVNTNAPYSFALEVVGFFEVAPAFPQDRTERLVKTNGATMLYGIAREMVRDLTSRGPHPGLMLPSVSFFEAQPKPQPPANAAPQAN